MQMCQVYRGRHSGAAPISALAEIGNMYCQNRLKPILVWSGGERGIHNHRPEGYGFRVLATGLRPMASPRNDSGCLCVV